MENLKTEEVVRNAENDLFVGMLVIAAGGMVLYSIGKSRGAKRAHSNMNNYLKGALAMLESQSKTEDK